MIFQFIFNIFLTYFLGELMKDSNPARIDEIMLSRYLDGEVLPEERDMIEEVLNQSEESLDAFQRLQSVSSLVRQSMHIEITPEEQASFDAELTRRLEPTTWDEPLCSSLFAPFKYLRQLSWQWQAAMAISLFLICYIPFLAQFSIDSGANMDMLLNSDYSNPQLFFDPDPEANFDCIWMITDEKDENNENNKEIKIKEDDSPLGFVFSYKA